MIKSLLRKLFPSKTFQKEFLADLKTHPNFKSKDEMAQQAPSGFVLEKGKIETIVLPTFKNQTGFVLTQWQVQPGDLVESGDIVCVIENQYMTMEFESVFKGRIVSICSVNQPLISGEEIFQIEGI